MRTESNGPSLRHRAWLVVNTHPGRELVALDHLSRQSYHGYCPRVRKTVRHARRSQEVLRPLFPGYVFVSIDPAAERWRPVMSTVGVRGVVTCGERVSTLANGFVESLMDREIDGAVVRPAKPYEIGQTVTLTGPAVEGIIATILDLDEKDRLVVLMDMLGRPVKARVSTSNVRPG